MRPDRDPAAQGPTAKRFWESRVEASADVPAISSADREWTYREFDAWINVLAHGLHQNGVGVGTLVATLLPTSVALLRLQLAIGKLGAVVVPMIPGSTAGEVGHVLEHSQAQMLITDDSGWRAAQRAGAGALELGAFVEGSTVAPGVRSTEVLEAHTAAAFPDPGIGPLDPMSIMYTSGSTGAPKGVIQPSGSLAATGEALAEALGLGSDDVMLCALPLFHTAATHMAFATAVAAGARLELMDRFGRESFWPRVRVSAATATLLFPSQLAMLMTPPATAADRDHSLRVCFSHVRNEPFCERFGVDVCAGWAMTETCGMGTVMRPGSGHPAPASIGVPFPRNARVAVRGEDGRDLAQGERGEIWFAHPLVMRGYHRDQAATAASLRDGWVGSGDIGSLDERGVLSFHGRVKHVIKRSGENIAGEEVELVLLSHPDVEDAVVCGVPDPLRTEEVHATVAPREGRTVDPAELADWCATRLSPWKVPRYIALAPDGLPHLANGKTDRPRIRASVDLRSAWQASPSRQRALQ